MSDLPSADWLDGISSSPNKTDKRNNVIELFSKKEKLSKKLFWLIYYLSQSPNDSSTINTFVLSNYSTNKLNTISSLILSVYTLNNVLFISSKCVFVFIKCILGATCVCLL